MARDEDEGVSLGTVTVKARKERAMLVEYEGRDLWIPYSQVHNDSEIHEDDGGEEEGKLVISSWLADKEGIEG
jgi:hypothetical protein